MGSKAGTQVYTLGGYRASGALNCGWVAMNLFTLLLRGPHTKRWFGWQDGGQLRKATRQKEQTENV